MNKFVEKIQTFARNNLSITKQETIFVVLLFLALFIGLSNKLFKFDSNQKATVQFIRRLIDSIAEAERKTFVGTDIYGNPIDTSFVDKPFKSEFSKLTESDTNVKINLNTASRVELMRLPGIGEKTAQQIIELRKRKPIRKKEDLLEIKGIGKKKLQRIEKFISF
ncbi:MAG: hypothetical protein CH6_4007 [Candidatus Kapaibacterium sp.]|nr:MAG: hypothetical protein CH6_4007 [Candidatus Kapabacteria bacterium]